MVKQLIASGADVNAVTNDSWTALHEASLNGHTAVVKHLIEFGAQVCWNIQSACISGVPLTNASLAQQSLPFASVCSVQRCGISVTHQLTPRCTFFRVVIEILHRPIIDGRIQFHCTVSESVRLM